jgi:SAM-dependent methyltransferase
METDVWGAIFRDQFAGLTARHELERDDGRVEVCESAAPYFEVPRSVAERELLDGLEGPVLDLGAGPGSYALYLQDRGIEVTAAEYSPGARQVCRERGCRHVASIDIRDVRIEPRTYRSVIVMGNTLGAHQTPETFAPLLQRLRAAVAPGGRLLFTMIDPLHSADPGHLRYHATNRNEGRPPGLIRMRVRYGDLTGDWGYLWMLTDEELQAAVGTSGWARVDERRSGPFRVTLLVSSERTEEAEGTASHGMPA